MRQFCQWYPLAEVAAHAPSAPGVFQVRVRRGLIAYPNGKSAMIYYGYADCLNRDAGRWGHGHGARAGDWLCRHITGSSSDMAAELELLLRRFVQRFGAPPAPPPVTAPRR